MYSKQTGSVCDISEVKFTELSPLHNFDHVLCSVAQRGDQVSIFQYNLVSGKSSMSAIDNKGNDKPIICSDNNKLFVIKKVTKKDKCWLALSTFSRKKFTDSLEICGEKTFDIFIHKKYENSKLWFSHCHGRKLHVFYSCYERTYGYNSKEYNSNELYLLTIHTESFDILQNQKLSEFVKATYNSQSYNDVRLRRDFGLTNFEIMFCHEKQEKLFMVQSRGAIYHDTNPWEKLLVFDMRNNRFYFIENLLPLSFTAKINYQSKFAVGKDGKIHAMCQYGSEECEIVSEIRTFKMESDKLVDDGVLWENFGGYPNVHDYPEVTSACFV